MSAGPVDWTEKMTETGPNATECNWTIGCSDEDRCVLHLAIQFLLLFKHGFNGLSVHSVPRTDNTIYQDQL